MKNLPNENTMNLELNIHVPTNAKAEAEELKQTLMNYLALVRKISPRRKLRSLAKAMMESFERDSDLTYPSPAPAPLVKKIYKHGHLSAVEFSPLLFAAKPVRYLRTVQRPSVTIRSNTTSLTTIR